MKTILTSLRSTKFSAVLILLTIVLCLIGFRPASAVVIGLDAVHYYDSPPYLYNAYRLWGDETGGKNFRPFRKLITDDLGYEIVPLREFSAEELAGVDVAVFMISTIPWIDGYGNPFFGDGMPYTPDQMVAIQAFASERAVFLSDSTVIAHMSADSDNEQLARKTMKYLVERGGGALFLAEQHGLNSVYLNSSSCSVPGRPCAGWNEIVGPFGIHYDYAEYSPDSPYYTSRTIGDFLNHPITEGVDTIRVVQHSVTSINPPSLDLTRNCGADHILAIYEPVTPSPATFTVFMNYDFTQTYGVGGFSFAPNSQVTLEIIDYPDGCVDYRATKTAGPDGGVGFGGEEGVAVDANYVVRLYDNHSPPNIKQHVVDYLTLSDVDLLLDTLGGSSNPDEEIYVRVFDPEQPFPRGSDFTVTANTYGNWQVSSAVDIGPGSGGWVQTNDVDGDHTQINWEVPERYLQVIWNSESTQVRGLVGYGWEPGSEVRFEFYYGYFR
ncbi:MAG: hypothetical protein ACW97O_14440, partial [Candidatus Thorarchaeota archaeon]